MAAPHPSTPAPLLHCMLLVLLLARLAGSTSGGAPASQPLHVPAGAPNCPCPDPSLCRQITAVHEKEVFGFAVSRDTPYDRYDWGQLTTAAWNDDPALMCTAHAAGARVVLDGRGASPVEVYGNATARRNWLAARVRQALDEHMDGINFDMEDPLPMGDPLTLEYTALVAEAAEAFHAAIPGSQVSVDIPWSPHGIDGRNFDWSGLAAAADILFIMAYDTQSQIWGRCVASANSPLALVRRGLEQWLELGVPKSKMVLGLPWYGYRYPCINQAFAQGASDLCELPPVTFAGCPCSDAAGAQLCYSDVQARIRRGAEGAKGAGGVAAGDGSEIRGEDAGPAGGEPGVAAGAAASTAEEEGVEVCEEPGMDELQASLYARCHLTSDPQRHKYQIWYDSPDTLSAKYALAAELGLLGVGMWNLDCLDYRCEDEGCRGDREAIWGSLRAFTGWRQGQGPAGGGATAS